MGSHIYVIALIISQIWRFNQWPNQENDLQTIEHSLTRQILHRARLVTEEIRLGSLELASEVGGSAFRALEA